MNIFFPVFLFLFLLAPAAYSEDIYLRSDSWCPYTCVPDTENEGYIIDVARAIFEPLGHRVHYDLMPWTRSLKMTETNAGFASPGASMEEGRGLVFHDKSVGIALNTFVTKETSNWVYIDRLSLSGKRIGAVKGYSYSPEIDDFIAANSQAVQWLHGDDPLNSGLKMLMAGHIDVLLDDKNVIIDTARKMDMLHQIRFAGDILPGTPLFVAFSPVGEKGKAYAKQMSAGIEALRQSGKLKEILARYDLIDWEAPK